MLIFLFGCGTSPESTAVSPAMPGEAEAEALREHVKLGDTELPNFKKTYFFSAGGGGMVRTNEVWKDEQGRALIFDYIMYDNEQSAANSFTLTRSKLKFPTETLSIGEGGWEARQGDRAKICFLRSRTMIIISFPDRDILLKVANQTYEKIDRAAKKGEF